MPANQLDPRKVRSLMHQTFETYARGDRMYPRLRFRGQPDDYPTKTQAIARALFGEWERIDEDKAFFQDAVLTMCEFRGGINEKGTGSRLVITRVGRNAIKMATLKPGLRPTLHLGEYWRQPFLEEFEGHQFDLGNGVVRLENGTIQGEPEGVIYRRSNAAALFLGNLPEPAIVDTAPL